MDIISSKENTIIKDVKKLKEKRYRSERNQFLVEGFRFVEEALDSSFSIPLVFVSESSMDKMEQFDIKAKIKNETRLYMVSDSVLRTLCATENPQGIVAVVNMKQYEVSDNCGMYILVDKVQDPGNVGTIIRSAHASGALGVILTKGSVDVYNEKALRSTMGSIFKVPIIYDNDLSLICNLRNKYYKLIVSSLDTDYNFYDVDLKGSVIVAVGNEGNGISDEIYAMADEKVKIPMLGDAESLNVGVAASVMMFEAVRQKKIL